MIKHYFKITFRNFRKYKTQSLIGIFGLAFGLVCFVPAIYWYRYETTYDSFYPGAKDIYCVYTVDKQSGKANELVPEILTEKLRDQYPAIESSTVFYIEQDNYSTDEMSQISMQTLQTDSSFFRVFPQEFVSGNVRQPFQAVHDIVITETMAIRLFGDIENAIGKQIKSKTFFFFPPYTITAVIKDPLPNTNLSFDAILFSEIIKSQTKIPEVARWDYSNMQVYVRLHPVIDFNEFAEQLHDFSIPLEVKANNDFRMLPISDIRYRLKTDVPFTLNFIRLFIAAGTLLIFSALFNFLNLYLTLFSQRFREYRQRIVHGAKKGQLIRQMMFELSCSILLSLLLAFFFIILICPMFSGLLNISVEMLQVINIFVVCGIGIMVLILLIAIIPVWRLSRLSSYNLQVTGDKKQAPIIRRMAVSLQFVVSIVLIVAALVVMMQMRFVDRKDLGFDNNGIIQLSGLTIYRLQDVQAAMTNELTTVPQIENITATTFEPQHKTLHLITEVEWPGKEKLENPTFQIIDADCRFAETFGLNMLMGEWWDEGIENKIVLNEEAVRVMGLKEPVGTIISVSPRSISNEGAVPMQELEVAGVVKNFHTLSLRSRIYPTIFKQYPSPMGTFVYIRSASGQEKEVIRRVSEILPDIDANFANVNPTPVNELYDRLNHSEQTGLKLFSIMATVCLLISLFGIYAVAVASSQRRRKEIAIRKVFGSKVVDIIRMFFREYTLQVIIAGAFALPLAYLAMSNWLQGYAYRTNIPLWLLAGVVTGVIAVVLLTVLGQVLKAANSNPGEVVKSE